MKEDCLQDTNIIKFAAESYVGVGGNPITLFTESAEWLYNCYQDTKDVICLQAAKQIIRAYMEMGLLYEASKDIFDKILDAVGVAFEEEFPKGIYSQRKVRCKVTQIREILGYWPHTNENQYNAEWISKDIVKKVKSKEYGCFCYGKRKNEITFELLILEENAYLMDLEKKRIYVFEQND